MTWSGCATMVLSPELELGEKLAPLRESVVIARTD
jgi:hypothetical protein